MEVKYEYPNQLISFRGMVVDERLREFRSGVYPMASVSFDSEEGRQLLKDLNKWLLRIRNRQSYALLLKFAQDHVNAEPVDLWLVRLFDMLDDAKFFGSRMHAEWARESLRILMNDLHARPDMLKAQ